VSSTTVRLIVLLGRDGQPRSAVGCFASQTANNTWTPIARTNGDDSKWQLSLLGKRTYLVDDAGALFTFAHLHEPLYRIRGCTSGRTLTNLAFGGDGDRTLFMTDSSTGTVPCADLEVAGKRMYSPQ
jgi:hypothetical protein